jgi:hypothetical protein
MMNKTKVLMTPNPPSSRHIHLGPPDFPSIARGDKKSNSPVEQSIFALFYHIVLSESKQI